MRKKREKKKEGDRSVEDIEEGKLRRKKLNKGEEREEGENWKHDVERERGSSRKIEKS